MSKTCLVSVQKSLRGDDTWSLSLQNAVAEVAKVSEHKAQQCCAITCLHLSSSSV